MAFGNGAAHPETIRQRTLRPLPETEDRDRTYGRDASVPARSGDGDFGEVGQEARIERSVASQHLDHDERHVCAGAAGVPVADHVDRSRVVQRRLSVLDQRERARVL